MQACRNNLIQLKLEAGTHAGLLLQRYLLSPVKGGNHKEDREKLLVAAIKALQKVVDLYIVVYEDWKRSVSGLQETLKVEGRMVLGLGSESPLETGLCLHHTYGTPVIPGCALKGLASHYCDRIWGYSQKEFRREIEEEKEGKKVKRPGRYFQTFFGTSDESGCIHFYDAMITPESLNNSLVMDVMTVHHSDYYKNGKKPPSDYDDPNPITFLSIRGNFTIVLKCSGDIPQKEARKWERLAMDLLLEALSLWGIGGKTSSGYGRMKKI